MMGEGKVAAHGFEIVMSMSWSLEVHTTEFSLVKSNRSIVQEAHITNVNNPSLLTSAARE